jgi:hypothetical protein
MRSVTRELLFAFLAWLVPFAVSVCIYHLKQQNPAAFESAMGLTLVGTTVVLGCLELRHRTRAFVRRGLAAGCLWMAANWLLDAVMFSRGPMRMSFARYAAEIAPAYLIIPVITAGLGCSAHRAGETLQSRLAAASSAV